MNQTQNRTLNRIAFYRSVQMAGVLNWGALLLDCSSCPRYPLLPSWASRALSPWVFFGSSPCGHEQRGVGQAVGRNCPSDSKP